MSNMSVNVAGVEWKNPVTVASGSEPVCPPLPFAPLAPAPADGVIVIGTEPNSYLAELIVSVSVHFPPV